MNYFIFTFLLFFVYDLVHGLAQTELLNADAKQCITSTNVSPEVLQKLQTKNEFPDDPNFKCFLKCLAVKMGGMAESGELLLDNVKSKFVAEGMPADQASKVVDKCKDLKGADSCDTAYKIYKCITEETIKSSG